MEARNRFAWRDGSEEPEFVNQQEGAEPSVPERVVPLRRRSGSSRRRASAAAVPPVGEAPAVHRQRAVDMVVGPARPAPAPAEETAPRPMPATSGDRGVVIPPGLAEQLRERHAELQARLERLDAEAQEMVDEDTRPKYSNHPADEAMELLDRAGRDAVARVLLDDMMQIDRALDRLADGSYGLCEDCHQPIPPKRLEARPTATLCVSCQGKRETQAARLRPIAH
jgi:DnaK suppressor protein